MIQIAYFSLVLAVCCAGYVLVAATIGLKTGQRRWVMSAAKALRAIAGLLTLAVLLLLSFLIQRDFRLAYVAGFTNLALAPGYVVSALWAGQEGSLLVWAWLMALCSALYIRKHTWHRHNMQFLTHPYPSQEWNSPPGRGRGGFFRKLKLCQCQVYTKPLSGNVDAETRIDPSKNPLPYLLLVFALTLGFFLVILISNANPFRMLPAVPGDGRGLNPLLQNIYMVIHPPILFLGYAGFLIPFALAFSALCTGTLEPGWIRDVRQWTLLSWYCLGMGILLGARWAYLELGWGGYWGWDPVENSSFLPWITSTALLHTLVLQRRRKLLRRWNLVLCILNFCLCIFGTWITRSGVLVSVHAYAQSPAGLYFLAFLLTTVVCTVALVLFRWKSLRGQRLLPVLISKETSFFLANQLFIGFGFAVLYGTVYPLFSEMFLGKKAVIGPPFFNMIAMILGSVLLALTGICQRIPWTNLSWQTILKRFWLPLTVAGAGALLLRIGGVRHGLVLLTGTLAVFVCMTVALDIAARLKTGHSDHGDQVPVHTPPFPKGEKIPPNPPLEKGGIRDQNRGQPGTMTKRWQKFRAQRRLLASALFHLGIVLICLGIVVSSAYKREQEITLKPGESAHFGTYRLQFENIEQRIAPEKTVLTTEVALYTDEKKAGAACPEVRVYNPFMGESQETREVGLFSTLTEDVYLILAELQEDQTATFICIFQPMISLMWIGGFLVFTAGMLFEISRLIL